MSEKQKCCKVVYSDSFGGRRCERTATVDRGRWYCTIHDPEYVKRKDAERQAKWDAERKERDERNRIAKEAAELQRRKAEAFDWLEAQPVVNFAWNWARSEVFFQLGDGPTFDAATLLEAVEKAKAQP